MDSLVGLENFKEFWKMGDMSSFLFLLEFDFDFEDTAKLTLEKVNEKLVFRLPFEDERKLIFWMLNSMLVEMF